MNIKNENISDIFLFASLDESQLELVASFCSIKTYSKNEHFFLEGDNASTFYSILSGKVKIYKLSEDGVEQILEIHETGNIFAEAAIFDRETYPAYASALEETTVIRIPKKEFIDLLISNPEISINIINAYSKRLRHFVNLVENLSLHDIKSRLAKYLLDNSSIKDETNVVNLDISKKELASILGTIPETLSRTLRIFKKENIIIESKGIITVKYKNKLKSYI